MDQQLYDEFGNYIGPELDEEEDLEVDEMEDEERWDQEQEDQSDRIQTAEDERMALMRLTEESKSQAIVLHEDKRYYPDAEEVYPDAEILYQEEDTQPLETPIIAPIKAKIHYLVEKETPTTTYDVKYLAGLMDHPHLVRNVALVGHLHHGKTSLMDVFVQQTHTHVDWPLDGNVRYLDTHVQEQKRELSIKAKPMSLVLPSLSGKHYLINMLDTPGHVNFIDEPTAAIRVSDGVVIVVDSVEGICINTQRVIKLAVQEGCVLCLCINKVDRLILELKLPPNDAYMKLKHTIEEANALLSSLNYKYSLLSPDRGNVCFASSLHGWVFSLPSFAQQYLQRSRASSVDPHEFAKRLWGNKYLYSDRKFRNEPESERHSRSFVQFILEPLYKMYAHVVGSEGAELQAVLAELGVKLTKDQLRLDVRPLLKLVLSSFFGNVSGFTQMLIDHVPSPIAATQTKVLKHYTGDFGNAITEGMMNCDPKGVLMINIVKLFDRPDASAFDSFGRVLSGTVRVGDRVRVLGESYSLDDTEDQREQEITRIWIFQGRYRIEVNRVTAGNWALFEGIDSSITKTATVTQIKDSEEACILRPLHFPVPPVFKVAIEPLIPSELPKMLDGLRKLDKSYLLLQTKVEESGEHVLLGTGEMFLDCALHDLRRVYTEIELKVSDPVVKFSETVAETSALKCFAETPNKMNKLIMVSEPLDQGLAEDIEQSKVRMPNQHHLNQLQVVTGQKIEDEKQAQSEENLQNFFKTKYGWDSLAARNIWAFGPDPQNGPNILVDDTLSTEVDKMKLFSIYDSVVQGFQWSTREGPLCDEQMRSVKFRLFDAQMADEPLHRSRGQLIPTARRVCYSSFLMAAPRLMEPIYHIEIQTPPDAVSAVQQILHRRRGHVTSSMAHPGTPHYIVQAFIPLMDSIGFETDLRTHTQGLAFCSSVFSHWDVVPGDPLDKNIILRPLEPAPADALAREFMIKTRRRKGLSEDVVINKYFDEAMLLSIAEQDEELAQFFKNQH